MLHTSAVFRRKDTEIEAKECVVDKVIRLSGEAFDRFSHGLTRDWDFIRDNPIETVVDNEGRYHCLLVVCDDRRDGILVNSEGSSYAYYSAFIPDVEGLLTIGRYPALASLTRNLAEVVEYLAEEYGTYGRSVVDLRDLESMFGYDFMTNGVLRDVVLDMLGERPEIKDFEFDKNELIIYGNQGAEPPAIDLSDPSVTKMDMYAYGYGWEAMTPLGMERAVALHFHDYQIYRLYPDGSEGAVDGVDEIQSFDGMFGVITPGWTEYEQASPIEVFILNRERYEKGEASGEWLTLPANADALRGLFERIGIDRPSEGAFTITAVRVQQEYLRDHVSKYDSLDELNMLASFLGDMMDFERDKFAAILTHRIADIGRGTAALINVCCSDNFDAFNMIDAHDAESLGRYYDAENGEKPDGVTFEQYGYQCVKAENGVFTEHGYIYFRYKELLPEYTGIVPDNYKITGEALRGLRSKAQERGGLGDKPSVLDQIKASRENPAPRQPGKDGKSKDKGGQEL